MNFQLTASQQYQFGKRDSTKKGDPLGKIIDMVRTRYVFSSFFLTFNNFTVTLLAETICLRWKRECPKKKKTSWEHNSVSVPALYFSISFLTFFLPFSAN